MNNEIAQFFKNILPQFNSILLEAKKSLSHKKFIEENSFTFISILYEYIREENLDFFFNQLQANLGENYDNNFAINLKTFLQEETSNIIDFFSFLKFNIKEENVRLIDFEWKFVGLSAPDNNGIFPNIYLKLIFNNGNEEIIECNYSNFKKLQEELEEAIKSFNYSYSKRIEKFSK